MTINVSSLLPRRVYAIEGVAPTGMVSLLTDIPRPWWILALLLAPGKGGKAEPIEGSLRLMKELFLVGKRSNPRKFYNFVPYRYGPCSFEVYHDLEFLKDEGLVLEVPSTEGRYRSFRLTAEGRDAAEAAFETVPEEVKQAVMDVKSNFNQVSVYSLLSYVYDAYPEYATRTEWVFRR